MNILYFSSDAFISVAAVSIVSLLESNKDSNEINIFIIDDGISHEKRNLLEGMIAPYKRRVSYIPAPDPSEFFKFPFKSRYQMGHSYMRMCIGSLLPPDVHRVLCLDSDTLVPGNIEELWEMDMGDNILAGVADCVNTLFYALTYENLIRWRRPTNFYRESEIRKAIESPRIIHFTRNFYMTSRPWVEGCDHPYTETYKQYMRMTPWPSVMPDNRSNWKKIQYRLFHLIPQSLLVYIVNILYNGVRPLMRWKNE